MIDEATERAHPKDDATPTEAKPLERDGERALCDWGEALLEEAAKAKTELAHDDQWDDRRNTFWGEQWPTSTPTFKPPIVVNEVQKLVFEEVSDLTDTKVGVFISKDPTNPERDEGIEKAFQAYWQRDCVDYQLMLSLVNAMIYGCGFIGCFWDASKSRGQGEVVTVSLNPKHVYPDPDAEDDERWRYVLYTDPLDLVEIRSKWVDQGWRVKPEAHLSTTMESAGGAKSSGRFKGPLYAPGSGLIAEGYAKARATVKTLFIYDDELEEMTDETIAADGTIKLHAYVVQKYPNGRMLQWCNGVVLFDGPNPYYGRFPIIKVGLVPSPGDFWPPESPVSGVMELQKAGNKMESQTVENAIRLNNGTVIADANSGINPSNYARIPGQPILTKQGTKATITYPPPMPPDMVNAGERMRGILRGQMGFTPSRIGTGQRGNVSAELNETEISQAMSLSRLRGRLLHMAVQKLAQMILERMCQFYTTVRRMPYVSASKWEVVSWQPVSHNMMYLAQVDPASFQVKSKVMMQRLYLALAKLGKISSEDLLKMLELPNAEQMAQRLNQELELAAQAKKKD